MQVQQVIGQYGNVVLGRKRGITGNYVDIVTGPNGCGKTEVLEVLLQYGKGLRPHPYSQSNLWPIVHTIGTPDKVVVQTFSPFSRFAAPRVDRTSLTEKYTEDESEQEKYVCIGLHKSSRSVGASLSRKILEEALFRLSENPESAETLFSVLHELGFQTRLSLGYRPRIGFAKVLSAGDSGQLLESYLNNLQKLGNPRPGDARLLSELNSDSVGNFIGLLHYSIDVIRHHRDHKSSSYRLPISLQDVRRDFHTIQAFALLRRLDLLSLTSCELRTSEFESMDVARTSSGQQQMLCALFGLATSVSSGCLALLDEPELSLHPEWQLKFVDALFKIASSVQDAHIIVATHSPLIVQQAVFHGADVVQMGNGARSSVSSSRTFLDTPVSVEQTLVDVFHTPIAGSAHVSNEIFQAVLKGETGNSFERHEALAKLEQLNEIYRNEKDGKTSRLVQDAIQLINTSDDSPPNGGAFLKIG
ncbi:ATP-binding protein [Achromobacter mucicolens]|uniref:ATP-binding protein n=1 Tax=Achromobacter mucicolens TaxID=1389922 RepID=A0ABD4YST1_9BURK|nr:ATP-binding protein [Achromobacter mucicolens]MDH1178233.1 ATP-binding protein [Achromobacter mucicolens]